MGIYGSEYTGAEHDLAIGKVLGNKYQEAEDPGCHLIGMDSSNPQNLFEVILPGKYTIFFYTDVATGNVPIEMPFIGNSPIFMQVTYDGENHHYQRITIGAGLWYRDLMSGNYNWTFVDMGVQAVEIIDNLTSTRIDAALSANMGRELKQIIDNLPIGNLNLIDNSGLLRGSSCWYIPEAGVMREIGIMLCGRPSFRIDGSVLSSDVEYLGVTSTSEHSSVIIPLRPYTASVWVKKDAKVTDDINVFIQISFFDAEGTATGGKKEVVTLSDSGWNRVKVLTESGVNDKYAKVMFGVTGNTSIAYFALSKLEEGNYATEWNPSYYDMWCEFDNANYINEEFVNAGDVKDHEGLVYDGDDKEYKNIPVAIGGGGGFITTYGKSDPPACDEVLWNDNTGAYFGRLKFFNTQTDTWDRVFDPPMFRSNLEPVDLELGWLDTTNEDNTITATLKYYDTTRGIWRPVTARGSGIWYFGPTPPVDTTVMWIKTPDMIPNLYYNGDWTPLHAVWGKNISEV